MGCQREIAAQIRDRKGDYLLALKGNQSGLEKDMWELVEGAMENDYADVRHTSFESDERGYGRREQRYGKAIEIPNDHPQRAHWKDLETLVVLTRGRTLGGHETWETQLYISSAPANAKRLVAAIRRHWSIENSPHWVLDVAFGEDSRRQQSRNGAANLASVSLLRQEKTNKRGAKNKMLACALDTNYLLKVLANVQF